MPRDGELMVIQRRLAELGLRVAAGEGWLVHGFLRDGALSPQRYLTAAERHKALQRELLALTRRLLTDARLRPVA